MSLKDYHRQLALYALSRASSDMTAGDLLEVMGTLSQSEEHPRECWGGRALYAQAVVGTLRALEKEGLVRRTGGAWNTGKGRNEPTWATSLARDAIDMPHPPEDGPPTQLPPPPDYNQFTRPELHTLLEYYDAQAAATTRFLRDVTDINERYRTRLLAMMGEG